MTQCPKCAGKTLPVLVDEYNDEHMGIPVILVNAITQEICVDCGAVASTIIPDHKGLIAAVAISRIIDPLKLNGQEIRFLRKALNFNGKEFAERLEVAPETVSRWEHDKEIMGPAREKLLRLIVGKNLSEHAMAMDFTSDTIIDMRIQSVRAHEPSAILLERVKVKFPEHPSEKYWGEFDEAA